MRRQGRGPAYIRLGPRAIGYHTRDLEKWLDRNRAVIPEHADTVARGD
jgi:predicted DNA-binding transcriptional regulator AlpA